MSMRVSPHAVSTIAKAVSSGVLATVLAATALVAGGCVEDTGQTVEKQTYKGAAIPAPTGTAEERTAALSERFNLIQTDR